MSGTTVRNLVLAATVVVMAASQAAAQTVRGVVQEIDTKEPIAGAAVAIYDMTGAVVGFSRTDRDGAFKMRIPTSQFSMRVIRLGFRPESLWTAGLDAAATTEVVVGMTPIPHQLATATIRAEQRRIRDTHILGLNLKALGNNIITPTEIAMHVRGARTYLDAIRAALPAGVLVSEQQQCAGSTRSGGLDGRLSCALVVVDGVEYLDPGVALDLVQPQWLDHAIFLNATDAGLRFGTGAAGGVLLLFTTYGGYALSRDVARELAPAAYRCSTPGCQ